MKRRQGFTIVELLVAMALILFMMAILSQAFVASTTAFRNLKAAGDMANKLRATTQLLQRDLSADHFEANKRLSDPNFWINGPPSQGFFRLWQGSPSYPLLPLPPPTARNFIEGAGIDGIGSYRSTDHALAFTIKLRGNNMSDFLSASGGMAALSSLFGPAEARYQFTTGSYNYQWGEVAWFLQPSINPSTGLPDMTVADPTTGSPAVPLYTLYRRQRLLVPDNNLVQPTQLAATAANFMEMSCWVNGTNLYFNNPMDITVPWRRFGVVPLSTYPAGLLYGSIPPFPAALWPFSLPTGSWLPPNALGAPTYLPPLTPYYPILTQQGAASTLSGADIQMTDVVSFDVRLLVPDIARNLTTPPLPNYFNPDPFVTLFTTYPTTTTNVFTTPPVVPPLPAPQFPFPAINYFNGNPVFYNPAIPATVLNPAVFDTWSSLRDSLADYSQWNAPLLQTSIPLWNPSPSPIPPVPIVQGTPPLGAPTGPIIQAIQITIRIWDAKTNQTRQVTIVQAM